MSTEIQLVEFIGDQIEAVMMPDGNPGVVVRRICENLGFDFASQYTKLRNHPTASIGPNPTFVTPGAK